MRISFNLTNKVNHIVALICMLLVACNQYAACAPNVEQDSPARLDAPLTKSNSFLVDFGYGAILRVPRILYPSIELPPLDKPVESKNISMVFWFPDMTLTGWTGQMDTIFDKAAGRYVEQKDRFKVKIIWLFYSPGDMGDRPKGEGLYVTDPRPARIIRNLSELTRDQKLTYTNSEYPGLTVLRNQPAYDNAVRDHATKYDPIEYAERADSPYELYMHCVSIECLAHVYSKSSHFQYRMIFPPEAVAHTDELIRSINKMIDQWAKK